MQASAWEARDRIVECAVHSSACVHRTRCASGTRPARSGTCCRGGALRRQLERIDRADQVGREGERHVGDALVVGLDVAERAHAFERRGDRRCWAAPSSRPSRWYCRRTAAWPRACRRPRANRLGHVAAGAIGCVLADQRHLALVGVGRGCSGICAMVATLLAITAATAIEMVPYRSRPRRISPRLARSCMAILPAVPDPSTYAHTPKTSIVE